jgi:hypothetical protein
MQLHCKDHSFVWQRGVAAAILKDTNQKTARHTINKVTTIVHGTQQNVQENNTNAIVQELNPVA